LFNYLPVALKNYPRWRTLGDPRAHDAMVNAGFAPGSEFLWDHHYAVYWDLTQRTYREEMDPAFDGALEAGIPFCASGASTSTTPPSCASGWPASSGRRGSRC
jgi:hypothetical protein